jgi:feruloyl esterase
MKYRKPEFLYRALGICCMMASPAVAAGASCEGMKALKLAHTRITVAEPMAAGAFTPPVIKLDFSRAIVPYQKLPAFCRVAGVLQPTADSDIRFEVWMPLSDWNRKLQGVGNGGFAGSIPYPSMGAPLSRNYAVAATDTGHTGIDASWAPGHPQKVIDFGYRAIHETAVAAKAILKAFYVRDPNILTSRAVPTEAGRP